MQRALRGREGDCGCAGIGSAATANCCCGFDQLVHVMGRKYTMPVVNRIGRRGARFSDLQLTLGVSSSTLAETLQDLETVGLINRVVFPERPPGSNYFLTTAGRALRRRFRPFLEAIRKTD